MVLVCDLYNDVKYMVKPEQIAELYSIHLSRGFGLCPFHTDTKPSMKFGGSNKSDLIKCFACGWGGSIIDFVSKIENTNSIGAVKRIDGAFGLNLYKENNKLTESELRQIEENKKQRELREKVKREQELKRKFFEDSLIQSVKNHYKKKNNIQSLNAKRKIMILTGAYENAGYCERDDVDAWEFYSLLEEKQKKLLIKKSKFGDSNE